MSERIEQERKEKSETNKSQMSANGRGPLTCVRKIFFSTATRSPCSGGPAFLCRGRLRRHVRETAQVAVGRAADTNGQLASPYHGRPSDEHALHREPAR